MSKNNSSVFPEDEYLKTAIDSGKASRELVECEKIVVWVLITAAGRKAIAG